MKLFIKNMVCPRCITAVNQLLKGINVTPVYVQLGEVLFSKAINTKQLEEISLLLKQLGFELLDDARKQQIEKIKSVIIEHVQNSKDKKFPFAEILSKALHKEYSQLSKLFSETEGVTIEHYVIIQKVEKAKELLAYNEMNLNEIAFKLGYSSVAHLSTQFKKVTGLTPSQFKAQGIHLRKSISDL
jgi:AraC-like DNA-binding protein